MAPYTHSIHKNTKIYYNKKEVIFLISLEEAGEMMDEIVTEIPEVYFNYLNGGVVLLENYKLHPKSKNNDLYTLGEYQRSYQLGRSIRIYYGSLAIVYGNLPKDQFKEKLRDVILHELTHHLESLSGEYDLEIKDLIKMEKYNRGEKMD